MNLLLILSTLWFSSASEKATADVFDLEGKTKLFNYQSERIYTVNTMDFTASFKDLEGGLAADEKAHLENGKLVKYEVVLPPTGEKGLIEVKDGYVIFNYWEKSKHTSSKEKVQPDILVSANLVPHLQAHMEDFLAKKDIVFRYAVWHRKETVGFKFTFDREEDGGIVVAKMVPTNFLYRSLVDPLYFALEKTTKKLVYIKGRTTPKIKKDGSWRDLDAYTKFHKEAP